jgi:transcriptional regulator with XRE-family HTH domain
MATKISNKPRELGIRSFRLDRRMTQAEMALRLGITRGTLAAIESGCKPIGKALARAIGAITRQTVGQVIDEWESMYGKKQKTA